MKRFIREIERLAAEIIRFAALRVLFALRDNTVPAAAAPNEAVQKSAAVAVPDEDESKLHAAFKVANHADWNWKTILEGLSEAASGLDADDPDERKTLDKIFAASDLTRQIEKCLMNQALLLRDVYMDVRRIRRANRISDGGITPEAGAIPRTDAA